MFGLVSSAMRCIGAHASEGFSITGSEVEQVSTIRQTSLDNLPKELVIHILSMLPNPSSVSLVCRTFRNLSIDVIEKRNFEKYGILVRNLSLLCEVPVDVRSISVLEKWSFPCGVLASSDQEIVREELSLLLDGKFDILKDPVVLNRFLSAESRRLSKDIVKGFFWRPSRPTLVSTAYDLITRTNECFRYYFSFGAAFNSMVAKDYKFRDFVADISDEDVKSRVCGECSHCIETNTWPQKIQCLSEYQQERDLLVDWVISGKTESGDGEFAFCKKTLSLSQVKLLNALPLVASRRVVISDFTMIPSGISCAIYSKKYIIQNCSMTSLPETMKNMNLRILILDNCPNLKSIVPAITEMTKILILDIKHCPKLSLENVEWPRSANVVIVEGRVILVRRPQEDEIDMFCRVMETKNRSEVEDSFSAFEQHFRYGVPLFNYL